jgi:hypothetical protein
MSGRNFKRITGVGNNIDAHHFKSVDAFDFSGSAVNSDMNNLVETLKEDTIELTTSPCGSQFKIEVMSCQKETPPAANQAPAKKDASIKA